MLYAIASASGTKALGLGQGLDRVDSQSLETGLHTRRCCKLLLLDLCRMLPCRSRLKDIDLCLPHL